MTQSVLMTIVFALLVYGVERNHLRQVRRQLPGRRELIGSTDIEDRDRARLAAELWALPPAADPFEPPAPIEPPAPRVRHSATVPHPRSAARPTSAAQR